MTDTQAIRERAERLIKLARKTNHGHPLAQQNFDDACFLEVSTVCRDLLAALDREKVLQTVCEAITRRAGAAESDWQQAEAQLATLRQLTHDIANDLSIILAAKYAPGWPDQKLNYDRDMASINKLRAAFPASAPKGEK